MLLRLPFKPLCAILVGRLGQYMSEPNCEWSWASFPCYLSQSCGSKPICLLITAELGIIYCTLFKICSWNRMINFLAGLISVYLCKSLFASFQNASENIYITTPWKGDQVIASTGIGNWGRALWLPDIATEFHFFKEHFKSSANRPNIYFRGFAFSSVLYVYNVWRLQNEHHR